MEASLGWAGLVWAPPELMVMLCLFSFICTVMISFVEKCINNITFIISFFALTNCDRFVEICSCSYLYKLFSEMSFLFFLRYQLELMECFHVFLSKWKVFVPEQKTQSKLDKYQMIKHQLWVFFFYTQVCFIIILNEGAFLFKSKLNPNVTREY